MWIPTEGSLPALPAPTLLERAQGCAESPWQQLSLLGVYEKGPAVFALAREGHDGVNAMEGVCAAETTSSWEHGLALGVMTLFTPSPPLSQMTSLLHFLNEHGVRCYSLTDI